MKLFTLLTITFIFLFTGCSQKEPLNLESNPKISKAKLKKVPLSSIEGFYEDDLNLAFEVFKKDCQRAKRYELFKSVCEKAKTYTNPSKFFQQTLQPMNYIVKNNLTKV